ncbi:hypothetical protein [Undibacterium sp. YM2]|uniref:hypothetical protein n=1 Tax=Undibacterium sp. YM2 TaxID=2058625 RepID=UPI001389CF24|nr:hypothetical protein [Undibacterium sp. YM2]
MTKHQWMIDRVGNSYLYRAAVPRLDSAISNVYAYFYEGRLYEMLVTWVFVRFSVEVTMNDASLNWQDARLQSSFKLAFLELGLPFQSAADVFTEKLGITFDHADAVFEFSAKKPGTRTAPYLA